MARAFHRRRRRHGQRTGRRVRCGRHDAGVREDRYPPLARGRRHRRAVQQRYLARSVQQRSRGCRGGRRFAALGGGASASTRPARWSCWARAASPWRSVRRAIPSATSSCGWTTAPSTRPGASTRAPRPCCAMSAAPFRPRWRRRSCSGLLNTCPAAFASAWQFFDLTDFLTWRCTGKPGALHLHGHLQMDLSCA